jgi:hypothetical protein
MSVLESIVGIVVVGAKGAKALSVASKLSATIGLINWLLAGPVSIRVVQLTKNAR